MTPPMNAPTGTQPDKKPSLLLRIALPIVVLGTLFGFAFLIDSNPPENSRRGDGGPPRILVEVATITERDYQVVLESYGTVQPRTRSRLVSQVGGQIINVDSAFRDGAFFRKGEVLIQIDPRDYAADVQIAEAALLDAQQALADAEARSAQAREDWRRLGNTGEPPALVAREPQRRAAAARVASSEAALAKAELALERTRVVAPFDGRLLNHQADVGQVVAANTVLGEIYATDTVEVRLPLRNRDLGFIELPELDAGPAEVATVEFASELDDDSGWKGTLLRTDGEIDPVARQLHVTARVEDPYALGGEGMPIKIGQYVTARLAGKTIPGAIVVPNENIYQGAFVYVVEDDVLDRRRIDIAWQNEVESIVASGLEPGERIVTTQLGQVTSGTRLTVTGAAARDRLGAQAGGGGGAASVPGELAQ